MKTSRWLPRRKGNLGSVWGRWLQTILLVILPVLLITFIRHPTIRGAASSPAFATRDDTHVPNGAKVTFKLDGVIKLERMKPTGQWYEATVPNTLDLAERTELSIHALTGDVDPDRYYG